MTNDLPERPSPQTESPSKGDGAPRRTAPAQKNSRVRVELLCTPEEFLIAAHAFLVQHGVQFTDEDRRLASGGSLVPAHVETDCIDDTSDPDSNDSDANDRSGKKA